MKDIPLKQALTLLDISPQPMVLLESGGKVYGLNQAFRALVGESAANAVDGSLESGMVHPLLGTSTVINWIMPDGDERWLAVEIIELSDTPGTQVRFYRDMTETLRLRHERDALREELQSQSLHDKQLTSLFSRYGIQLMIEPLVARSRRYNSPLSLITLSVTTANESACAEARATVAALLKDQTRWADLIGCNDNQEFILVLQETTRDDALHLVDKLNEQFERINKSASEPLSVCYGVTDCQKNDNVDSILERAETALAEAAQNNSGQAIAL